MFRQNVFNYCLDELTSALAFPFFEARKIVGKFVLKRVVVNRQIFPKN